VDSVEGADSADLQTIRVVAPQAEALAARERRERSLEGFFVCGAAGIEFWSTDRSGGADPPTAARCLPEDVAIFGFLDQAIGVRWEKQPLRDQPVCSRSHRGHVAIMICVPLFQRGSRVAS
jgi:hypothetical protein